MQHQWKWALVFGWILASMLDADEPTINPRIPIEPSAIKQALAQADKPTADVPISLLSKLPMHRSGTRSSAQGHWVGLLRDRKGGIHLLQLRLGQRKVGDNAISFLLLDRWISFDDQLAVKIDRSDLHWYPESAIDGSLGQLVPKNLAGDVTFLADQSGLLRCHTDARLLFPNQAWLAKYSQGKSKEEKKSRGGSAHPIVGQFELQSDAKLSGTLVIEEHDARNIKGRFVSKETSTSFNVSGTVETTGAVEIVIAFPMVEQKLIGQFWTKAGDRITGVTDIQQRQVPFLATKR